MPRTQNALENATLFEMRGGKKSSRNNTQRPATRPKQIAQGNKGHVVKPNKKK